MLELVEKADVDGVVDDTVVLPFALRQKSRQRVRLAKRAVAVRGTRTVRKADLVHNGATPHIEVDAQTYEVRADGELLRCEPAGELPLAQRYFLF